MTEQTSENLAGNSASGTGVPPLFWFEADHARLVNEVRAMQEFPDFTLSLSSQKQLIWEGEAFAPWPNEVGYGDPVPLRVRLTYPLAFPIAPINVMPLSPELPTRYWGHEWHRWSDGSLCLGHPDQWDISYSARDVVEKVSEWWFNFLAYLFAHIDEMPDVGRAVLAARPTSPPA